MSWKEKVKEWGGGDISFLTEDGECITFVVIGEPYLIEGKFRGQDTQRVGVPAITADGFTLLIVGKRVARRLAKHEKSFGDFAFDLVRHGSPRDQKATYELTRCDIPELTAELLDKATLGVLPEDIAEAVAAATEVAQG